LRRANGGRVLNHLWRQEYSHRLTAFSGGRGDRHETQRFRALYPVRLGGLPYTGGALRLFWASLACALIAARCCAPVGMPSDLMTYRVVAGEGARKAAGCLCFTCHHPLPALQPPRCTPVSHLYAWLWRGTSSTRRPAAGLRREQTRTLSCCGCRATPGVAASS